MIIWNAATLVESSQFVRQGPVGSASSMAYSFATDPNTGIMLNSGDDMYLGAGGSLYLRVVASSIPVRVEGGILGLYPSGGGEALRGNGHGIPAAEAMYREADKAAAFARKAASGGLGFPVNTILHIGIGGSDLGPRLIWDAKDMGAPSGEKS